MRLWRYKKEIFLYEVKEKGNEMGSESLMSRIVREAMGLCANSAMLNGEKYILDYSTLEEIEELLDPKLFYRANRQSIIYADAIQSVKPHENQKLTLTLRAPLKMEMDISREKAPAFKKWFDR